MRGRYSFSKSPYFYAVVCATVIVACVNALDVNLECLPILSAKKGGDSDFGGFFGQKYAFRGIPNNVYNLLATETLTVNGKLIEKDPQGPTVVGELGFVWNGETAKVACENNELQFILGNKGVNPGEKIEVAEALVELLLIDMQTMARFAKDQFDFRIWKVANANGPCFLEMEAVLMKRKEPLGVVDGVLGVSALGMASNATDGDEALYRSNNTNLFQAFQPEGSPPSWSGLVNGTLCGCMEENALNFDPNATLYDGSCIYAAPNATEMLVVMDVDCETFIVTDAINPFIFELSFSTGIPESNIVVNDMACGSVHVSLEFRGGNAIDDALAVINTFAGEMGEMLLVKEPVQDVIPSFPVLTVYKGSFGEDSYHKSMLRNPMNGAPLNPCHSQPCGQLGCRPVSPFDFKCLTDEPAPPMVNGPPGNFTGAEFKPEWVLTNGELVSCVASSDCPLNSTCSYDEEFEVHRCGCPVGIVWTASFGCSMALEDAIVSGFLDDIVLGSLAPYMDAPTLPGGPRIEILNPVQGASLSGGWLDTSVGVRVLARNLVPGATYTVSINLATLPSFTAPASGRRTLTRTVIIPIPTSSFYSPYASWFNGDDDMYRAFRPIEAILENAGGTVLSVDRHLIYDTRLFTGTMEGIWWNPTMPLKNSFSAAATAVTSARLTPSGLHALESVLPEQYPLPPPLDLYDLLNDGLPDALSPNLAVQCDLLSDMPASVQAAVAAAEDDMRSRASGLLPLLFALPPTAKAVLRTLGMTIPSTMTEVVVSDRDFSVCILADEPWLTEITAEGPTATSFTVENRCIRTDWTFGSIDFDLFVQFRAELRFRNGDYATLPALLEIFISDDGDPAPVPNYAIPAEETQCTGTGLFMSAAGWERDCPSNGGAHVLVPPRMTRITAYGGATTVHGGICATDSLFRTRANAGSYGALTVVEAKFQNAWNHRELTTVGREDSSAYGWREILSPYTLSNYLWGRVDHYVDILTVDVHEEDVWSVDHSPMYQGLTVEYSTTSRLLRRVISSEYTARRHFLLPDMYIGFPIADWKLESPTEEQFDWGFGFHLSMLNQFLASSYESSLLAWQVTGIPSTAVASMWDASMGPSTNVDMRVWPVFPPVLVMEKQELYSWWTGSTADGEALIHLYVGEYCIDLLVGLNLKIRFTVDIQFINVLFDINPVDGTLKLDLSSGSVDVTVRLKEYAGIARPTGRTPYIDNVITNDILARIASAISHVKVPEFDALPRQSGPKFSFTRVHHEFHRHGYVTNYYNLSRV